jgi:hypothetical protein
MSSLNIPETAERLFSQVFHNLTQRQADVTTFRKLSVLGQEAAAATLTIENYRFALSILHDSQYDQYFLDRKGAVAFLGGPEKMGSNMTAKQLHLFNAAVDAASLVFVHSAVDAAVSDLCRVTYIIDPSRWRPFVEAQKVSLSEIGSTTPGDVWKMKLDAHVAALEKESLRKRTDRLFAICKPDRTFDPIGNFQYDIISVERLDKLRQDVIHGSGPDVIPNCDAELEYLTKVGLYFFSMVNKAFGVKINPMFSLGLQLPVSGAKDKTK